jgi:hypothetical protein
MTDTCKCPAVASVVLKEGERLCGRCRYPLGTVSEGAVDKALAEARERATRIGSAAPSGSLLRDNDPDWVPEEHRSRDPRHPAHWTDGQVERHYADYAAEMRERGTGEHGRVVACIPPELRTAKQRVDPHYWDDPKNLRKHKDFLVNE